MHIPHKEYDRFNNEHVKRSQKVAVEYIVQTDFCLFQLRMDSPILRLLSQSLCFIRQDNWNIRLSKQKYVQDERQSAHDACNVLRPTPTQMARHNEAANKRSNQRTNEDAEGEDCNLSL